MQVSTRAVSKSSANRRYSKEEWLNRSLEIIASEGETKLRIDRLVKKLGVTNGSFYWHFKDRAHFVRELAEHWAERSTFDLVKQARLSTEDLRPIAKQRFRQIIEQDLHKFDVAMRAWAAHEPEIAPIVKRVDRARLSSAQRLFEQMGFTGDELEMRTRIFILYVSLQDALFMKWTKKKKHEMVDRIIEFFIH